MPIVSLVQYSQFSDRRTLDELFSFLLNSFLIRLQYPTQFRIFRTLDL